MYHQWLIAESTLYLNKMLTPIQIAQGRLEYPQVYIMLPQRIYKVDLDEMDIKQVSNAIQAALMASQRNSRIPVSRCVIRILC